MSYDVYGLGNALVDMEFAIDDGFLRRNRIVKGHMTLVDEPRLIEVLSNLEGVTPKHASGGSAANTMLAAQAFGASTFYSCKVASDDVGERFLRDLNHSGIQTNPHPKEQPGKSGQCLVLVTPDAERSMNTFLGISQYLSVREINERALLASRHLYIEGYLSSSETAREAAILCREIAETHGVKTALTLSDPSMVRHFRDQLTTMLGEGVDHLFCNEEEALGWARTDRLDVAINELKDVGRAINITLGARGSLIASGRQRKEVAGFPVRPIDTNGAGDIYAGACLYAWSRGATEEEAARFANYAAAQLVTRYGARLENVDTYRQVKRSYEALGA